VPINVVSTISGRCKRCYSCIRNCPAKAIKVEDGQAMVMPELCIGCGHCVVVCSQNAKKIVSGIEQAKSVILSGQGVACLAPSFVARYHQLEPGQVITALRKLGFTQVWEVAFGATLVSGEYENKILANRENKNFISTACPAVINLVEKHYPELIPYLVSVVSPMIALGRYLKLQLGSGCRVVFIGPCLAKKEEANDPMVQGAIDAVLTFAELDEMLAEEGIDPAQMPVSAWDSPSAGLGRLYPVAGGLLRSASQQMDPLSCEILKVEGKEHCLDFLQGVNRDKDYLQLVDILFCDGCISGPMLDSELNRFERQQAVARFTQNNLTEGEPEMPALPAGLDLSRTFRNRSQNISNPTEAQIRSVLTEMGKFSPEDELNCGACGYVSCREKAAAVVLGFAESKMCLPYLISNLESQNIHLQNQLTTALGLENIIGNSAPMQRVYQIINKVAPTDSTVLIRGKSGTGKELVAQALHQKSLRQGKHFVSINCAALPENLLESELFGHAKGSFTGAVGDKKGLFEEAHGGTLFLDEIGDVSPQLQAKLLRVLQEGEYLRIGETIPRVCDVRIIAATNQDLEELIAEKKFREDLYYRLNVVSISLPELRQRREDIPVLVKFFLDKFNRKHSKNVTTVSKEAMMALTGADWPGNVRELENAIERAVILCEGREILPIDLPPSLRAQVREGEKLVEIEIADFNQAVADYKRRIILKALSESEGVQAQAARRLGIGRSTLNEIMKRLEIEATNAQ